LLVACSFEPRGVPDGAPGNTPADASIGTPDAQPADDATAFACPAEYTLRVEGSCHRTVATLVTWDLAEADCETAGAHLVVVDDVAEAVLPDNVWIGYTEIVTPGTFRWVTGAAVTFEGWASTEPGSIGGASCVEARADGWHDDNCPEAKAYVCEYDGRSADPAQF
jgi:hypothetical protein